MREVEQFLAAPLRLARGFFLFTPSKAEVQVRSGLLGGRAFSLKDPSRAGYLAQLLAQLDGSQPLGALVAEWPEPARSEVVSLLRNLVEKGALVVNGGDSPSATASADVQTAIRLEGLLPYKLTPIELRRIADARIALLGAGVLGSRAAVQIVMTGVRKLRLWDPTPVSAVDQALCPAYAQASHGNSRAESLAAYLQTLAPSLEVTVCQTVPEALSASSLAVVAADQVNPALCDQVNLAALESGTPWTHLAMDGSQGLIGPSILPGQTACYTCLEAYWAAHSGRADQFSALAGALRDREPSPSYYGLPAFADVVAGLWAADLPVLLARGPAQTLGQVLALACSTLSAITYAVPRAPRCPSCGLTQHAASAN
jgi:bacteriocin biosynthesis cyclodehydratase domain-containing protein